MMNPMFSERLKRAIETVLTNKDGIIFVAYLQTRFHMFDADSSQEARILREFGIGLMGELDLYSQAPDFQYKLLKFLTKDSPSFSLKPRDAEAENRGDHLEDEMFLDE
jgi:hypothetical protein